MFRGVKLQRSRALKVGEKEYYRWTITLPPDIVTALGWGRGDILDAEVKGDKVVIRRLAPAPRRST